MIYGALTLWLFLILLTGAGLYRCWTKRLGGAVVDWLILPATLIAETLYAAGRLLTESPRAQPDASGSPRRRPAMQPHPEHVFRAAVDSYAYSGGMPPRNWPRPAQARGPDSAAPPPSRSWNRAPRTDQSDGPRPAHTHPADIDARSDRTRPRSRQGPGSRV